MRIFPLLASILFSINICAQKKIRPDKLMEDFDFLVSELRTQHQGLYQYVDKTTVDSQLAHLRESITQPIDRLEFYGLIRKTIAVTNEGHTTADLPKWTKLKLGLSKSFLPIAVKYCDGSYIITQNYGAKTSLLSKGDKLLAVNGTRIEAILESLLPLIPTDGFNKTSRHEWLGGINFSLLYRLVHGKTKAFDIEVQELGGNTTKMVSLKPIRYTAFKGKNATFPPKSFDFSKFQCKAINDSIAYLSIPGFGDDDLPYETFYKTAFQQIDSLGATHLILDIQANGGGTEGNENLLFSYLSEEPVQKYKRVTMMPKSYEGNATDPDYIFDQWELTGPKAVRGNFTLFSDYYSDLGYGVPNTDLRYGGKLYVLISGLTFSGGAEFASLVKMTDRGIFIGEETGGTYEGNVSGYSETITLPHSKIRVNIPIIHFQINVSPTIKGRGVMPDHEVPQTWEDYQHGKNTKLAFAKKLIMD
ncbi:MAG: S41 family peptidase [Flavobacteriaceae bacterium]